jgi:hypothetical protein
MARNLMARSMRKKMRNRARVALCGAMLALGPTAARAQSAFPGAGHVYLVDFHRFVVELYFQSETKMTYTGILPDGSRGQSETVTIAINSLRPDQFLVTWTEQDKTTVVHVEDFLLKTIHTNITNPDLTFEKYDGTMRQLDPLQ